MNILIVHYNTPELTECLVKSINKFVGANCHIYIFDNSDKQPFTYKQDNITIIDNTRGEVIDFEKWLNSYTNKLKEANGNGYASAKHCYTIEKCFDIINDNFVLMDSDILLKRDISDICDESCVFTGQIEKQNNKIIDKLAPYLCYINVNFCKEHGLHYFNEGYMYGLNMLELNKQCNYYDTGAGFYFMTKKYKHKIINLDDYIVHLGHASWGNGINEEKWLKENEKLYIKDNDVIVSFTTYKDRVKYAPRIIESLLKQTIKPYKICLTLYKGDLQYVTNELQKYLDSGKVELIISEDDIAPHKKYYYVMKKYKEYPIITFDDDIVYNNDVVETLINSYHKFPQCISARRVHKITYNKSGEPLPYQKWKYEYKEEFDTPSFDLFATNGAGVLFPPNILDVDNIPMDRMLECLYADDVFLKWWENKIGIQVVWVKNDAVMSGKMLNEISVMRDGLAYTNNLRGRNDQYIKILNLKKKDVSIKPANQKVVYTCITGGYESLIELSKVLPDFDYICFTDNMNIKTDIWVLKPIPDELLSLSKSKQQRMIKILPHKYLPQYNESIWIDGSMDIIGDVNKFISEYCADEKKTVVIRKHPSRTCIYQEAKTCGTMKKDTAANIEPQIKRYKNEGFPTNYGLVETNVIYRKHNDAYCKQLMEKWADEVKNGSHRDQLSFNYCLWKVGDKGFKYINLNVNNGKIFKWYPRHDWKPSRVAKRVTTIYHGGENSTPIVIDNIQAHVHKPKVTRTIKTTPRPKRIIKKTRVFLGTGLNW